MNTRMHLFLKDDVREIFNRFAVCFNVHLTFYSLTMDKLEASFPERSLDYCEKVQQDLGLLPCCLQQDEEMCLVANRKGGPVSYNCHAGLREMILPVMIDKMPVGFIMIGQLRTKHRIPEKIALLWQQKFGERKRIEQAFREAPLFTVQQVENMLSLMTLFIDYIISFNYIVLERSLVFEQIVNYIDQNIGRAITRREVAKKLCKSESSISHTVKNHIGISFTRLVAQRKIRRFEYLIQKDPSLIIKEAAAKVGYPDSLYFSRVYKNSRGHAPGVFLREVNSQYPHSVIDNLAQ
ncbi:MAG: PocR ligand-binding domain-containing protein [Spirochaetales bacterium]|nr:PocR ligand-binding domain-containing protein [Spirochaetales bacterium]